MARKMMIAGNWKMNGLLADGVALAQEIKVDVKAKKRNCEFVVCPPFTLLGAVKKALNMPRDAVYNFYNATAIVIIANDRNYKYAKQDCGAAMENIMLAAHSLGIASCWINQLCDTYDDPGVRSLLESFGIGKDKIVSAVAALGYAASPVGEPAPRKAEAINFID